MNKPFPESISVQPRREPSQLVPEPSAKSVAIGASHLAPPLLPQPPATRLGVARLVPRRDRPPSHQGAQTLPCSRNATTFWHTSSG